MSTSEDAGIVYGPVYRCPECLQILCQNSLDLEDSEKETPCWTCREEEDRNIKSDKNKTLTTN